MGTVSNTLVPYQRKDERKDRMKRTVLAVALVAAAESFILPGVFPYGDYTRTLMWSAGGSLVWVVMAIISLARWRWRGAWILVGGPFALFYPIGIIVAFAGCAGGRPCL
jgi:hypothetical protein